MKTLIALTLTLASLAGAQTINISVANVSPAVIADIRTHWLQQAGGSIGKTSAAINATDSTVTIALDQSELTAAPAMPLVGQSVLVDGEPAKVTAISGTSITVERGTLATATKSAHESGVSVTVLNYRTPWEMLVSEAIRPWVQSVIQQLGPKSATLGAAVSGSVTQ